MEGGFSIKNGVFMGNLFGRSSWSEEKEEFKRQMEEMIDKVNKLEEAQMRTADVVERPFGTGLDSLLSNVSKMWNDLGERLAALDKREGEARKEQERLRLWEEELKERSGVLDDKERSRRREREAMEREKEGEEGAKRDADAQERTAEAGAEEKGRQEADAPGDGTATTAPGGGAMAEAVEKRLEELAAALRESAYKDNLIKELHGELQRHRQGMLAEVAKPYLRSVMKIHERLRDTAHYYARAEVRAEEDAYGRFLRKVESDVLTVQDMLEDDFGVTYFEAEPGGEFVPKEYHALKTVATTDAALAGRVAECLYGGFRSEETGKVVKAAQVTLYKLENENK